MASLKNIKLKIQSYKKTGTVTRAMQAVSAAKMRKSQERALGGRMYAAAALSILEHLSASIDLQQHPLMFQRDLVGPFEKGPTRSLSKTCIIVITSDKGLAGSFNGAVIRRIEQEIKRLNLPQDNVIMIAIGRRGADYFMARGFEVRERFENLSDDVSEAQVRAITDRLLAWHAAGEIDTCMVAYTNFVSTFEQAAIMREIIPITPELIRTMITGIRPVKGKYAPAAGSLERAPSAYTIEPDPDAVLSELLPHLLNIAVFHALLESKASEHSARMIAMKNATDKARDMTKSYTRVFNKVRQAAITREVSEIVGGIEAMK